MRAEIQRFRGFADEKYFFCSYYKMKTSSKNGRLPLRTGGKQQAKKALNHKIYGKRLWNTPFSAKMKKCQMRHSFRETLPIFCTNAQK
jgi:hypothetical protein